MASTGAPRGHANTTPAPLSASARESATLRHAMLPGLMNPLGTPHTKARATILNPTSSLRSSRRRTCTSFRFAWWL